MKQVERKNEDMKNMAVEDGTGAGVQGNKKHLKNRAIEDEAGAGVAGNKKDLKNRAIEDETGAGVEAKNEDLKNRAVEDETGASVEGNNEDLKNRGQGQAVEDKTRAGVKEEDFKHGGRCGKKERRSVDTVEEDACEGLRDEKFYNEGGNMRNKFNTFPANKFLLKT